MNVAPWWNLECFALPQSWTKEQLSELEGAADAEVTPLGRTRLGDLEAVVSFLEGIRGCPSHRGGRVFPPFHSFHPFGLTEG